MKIRASLPLATAIALMLACQVASQTGLDRIPKAGEVARYRVRFAYTAFGSPGSYTAIMKELVTAVGPNEYSIQRTLSDYETVFEGDSMRLGPEDMPVETRKLGRDGAVLMVGGTMSGADNYRLAQLDVFRSQGKATAISDAWTVSVEANLLTGVRKASASFKVESEETIDSEPCMKIQFDYKEVEGADPTTASGHMWVRQIDGVLARYRATWHNAPLAGFGSSSQTDVEYDLLP